MMPIKQAIPGSRRFTNMWDAIMFEYAIGATGMAFETVVANDGDPEGPCEVRWSGRMAVPDPRWWCPDCSNYVVVDEFVELGATYMICPRCRGSDYTRPHAAEAY